MMARLSALAPVFALVTLGCSDDSSSAVGGAGPTGGASGLGGEAGQPGLVCDEPLISKGPWSFAIDETTARIRWEACAAGSLPEVVVEPDAGGESTSTEADVSSFELTTTHTPLGTAQPDYAGTYYMHEAALSGLAPSTCYRYHLAADDTRSGRFCTARASGESFKFMAIGDTNPTLGTTEHVLAHALEREPELTIHGGDIQYYSSLIETWASWFPIMQPMLSQGGFFPAIGNHEVEDDEELSQYSLRFFGGAGFDGGETYYQFHTGGVWFFNVNTEEPITQGSPQAIWLTAAIEAAAQDPDYRFGVVYFHRPLVTCGDVGDDPAAREFLEPFFEANNVLFVIGAHMHGYERFDFPTGPTYMTIAGGGGVVGNVDENIDRPYCVDRVMSGPIFHAVIFDVGPTEISLEAIDDKGAVVDTFARPIP